MAHALSLAALLLACAVIAGRLLRSAYRQWGLERGGRAYELPVEYRGVVLRLAGAGLVGTLAVALLWVSPAGPYGQTLPWAPDGPGTGLAGTRAAATPSRPSTSVPPSATGPGAGSAQPGRPARHQDDGEAAKAAEESARSAKTAEPTEIAEAAKAAKATGRPSPSAAPGRGARGGTPRTVGRPAGGVLQELADGTRVWLPRQYGYPSAKRRAFPLVVAHVAERDRKVLFKGFDAHAGQGLADPFVVVLPPTCDDDPAPMLEEVARHYRVVDGAKARGVLGTGDDADCAVRQELEHPSRYAAAVGAFGRYEGIDGVSPSSREVRGGKRAGKAGRPQVLLGSVAGDADARASSLRLRERVRGTAEARVLDTPADRRRLLAVAAGYFTEKLAGPAGP